MIRISKEEFYATAKFMEELGLDIKGYGGTGMHGFSAYRLNGEKIAHHQFEYEEYYEFDEKLYKKI